VTGLYGGGMASWWHRDVIAAGKLPLMLCFLAFVVTFVTTRTITRMIRDGRGPFRNRVTANARRAAPPTSISAGPLSRPPGKTSSAGNRPGLTRRPATTSTAEPVRWD
jgi:hypothetical protein